MSDPVPTSTHSLQFLLERDRKEHDLINDVLHVILLDEHFVFNPATHSTYTDISANEIPGEFGYLQNNKVLSNVALAIQTAENRVHAACSSPSWEVSGGDWAGVRACAIINTTHVNNTVVLCIDFDTIYLITDGIPFQIDFSNGLYLARAIIPTTT